MQFQLVPAGALNLMYGWALPASTIYGEPREAVKPNVMRSSSTPMANPPEPRCMTTALHKSNSKSRA